MASADAPASDGAAPTSAPRRQRRGGRAGDVGIGVLSVAAVLVAWEAAVRTGLVSERSAPPPTRVAETLVRLATDGFPVGIPIWEHVGATLRRVVLGFAIAAAAAVPLGLLIGRSRLLDEGTSFIITFARSVAAISLLPLAVAIFGVGEVSKVFVVAFACFWIVLANTAAAAAAVDEELLRAARSLGVGGSRLFVAVVLPASLPRIFTGLKVALGMAFLVIVAAEMIGTVTGLGALIIQARTFYRTDIAIAGMVVIGLVGLLLVALTNKLERVLLPWSPAVTRTRR